jgi:hypothetical protein
MNVPDTIQICCMEYRILFATNKQMGDSLGVSAEQACQLVTGSARPSLDAIITMQTALRQSTSG